MGAVLVRNFAGRSPGHDGSSTNRHSCHLPLLHGRQAELRPGKFSGKATRTPQQPAVAPGQHMSTTPSRTRPPRLNGPPSAPAYEEGVRGSETLRIATMWSLRGSVRSCACRIYLYLIDLSSAASCYPSAHPGRGDTRPETHPEGENPTSHAHNNAITLTEPTHTTA